jgi:hypothetical protein
MMLAGFRFSSGDRKAEGLIYLLNSQMHFAPMLAGNYPMMAGVPQYAVYLAHRYYDSNITSARAQALAEYLISETASQDPKVGGPIQIAEITPSGYKRLTDDELLQLHQKNEQLNKRLREFFLKGGVP